MRKAKSSLFLILIIIFLINTSSVLAQEKPIFPNIVEYGVFLGETPPLRELPTLTPEEIEFMKDKALKKAARKVIKPREYPYETTALPKGSDEIWQRTMGMTNISRAPLVNFEGQTTSSFPPDCNGTIGPNHYMQTVNTTYAIYSRTGTLLAGPTNMNLLFNGVSGSNCNDGDPLVQYDEQAQRWIAVEFSLCGSNDLMLIAVSSTNDPTGTWYAYSFDVADVPDYEKIGVWRDGYYMGTNTSSGNDIYVFERSVMLNGGTNPKMIAFDNPWRPSTGFMCVPPLDNDGTPAPIASPGLFIAFNDDGVGGGSDQLWIYELTANWTSPSSSTFVRSQQINVTPFDSQFDVNWNDITQPNSQKLDGVPQVIMNAPQFRNFGSYQTIVCCHTVDVNGNNQAGIRWYELRRTTGAWSIRQSGTYAPDNHSRWMGSIMLNGNGKIGLAYSISSSTIFPGIRYCGQSSAAYANALGLMDIPEEIIHNGTVAQTTYNRWGDYALLSVDPNDDETFWFTSQYVGTGGTLKRTKIASFRLGNNPLVSTSAATNVTTSSATLNGTVNPNGLTTNYYFQWGTSISYGNVTPTLSAGSGSTNISVSATISGLIAGTTYHFRLIATNSDGTSTGNNFSFTPGAASITTSSVSNITLNSAVCGGNVITDGGSNVTSRGICWGTNINPTTSNNTLIIGSGLGIFSGTITGLLQNTTYYVRAFAINSNGTYYGDNVTFTTLCSIFSLPFSESFTNTVLPNCWNIVDNQGNGQIWKIGTITNQTPNPLLTGNYAFLNSDTYGSGNTQNSDLVTPTLDLSNFNSITLNFKYYFKSYTGSSGNLYYSTNNGLTWMLISSFTATSTVNPTVFNQVISGVAGQSLVKFKWNYTGSWGYYWAVDDINITGTQANLPIVTTSSVSGITSNSAVSGGSISSSGASPVTARGVCWGTSINPSLSGNYTVDGNGTGTYFSTITGLLPNTAYYIRAYATNSFGTSYGDNLQFSTSCNVVTTFPWSESFENNGNIPSCWSQEYVNNSGLNWLFITGNGSSNPSSAKTGIYNACLKDNTAADNKTKLITPPFKLNALINPVLSFWHTQAFWSPDQDILEVYYKTSAVGTWQLLASYTTSITSWTQRNIPLPNASSEYYIAFEGNAKYGYGVCIDDVSITGTQCSLPANAGTISGLAYVCNGQTNIIYSISPVSGATSYLWQLPTGFIGTSSTNSISVNIDNSATSGNISVKGINSCGEGNSSSLPINVNSQPSNTGAIIGKTNVCQGESSVIYTIAPIANATSYTWSLPLGVSGFSTSNTITVDFSNSATSGNISVKGINSCGEGNSSSLPINVNSQPSNAGAIIGKTNVCQGESSVIYTIAPIANATSYTWSLPLGVSGFSTSNTITVDFSNSATSGNISVKGINSCGEGNNFDFYVNVNSLPAQASQINGQQLICAEAQNVDYNVGLIQDANYYVWNLPFGATGSSVSNSISVSFPMSITADTLSVMGVNNCGEGLPSFIIIDIKTLPDDAGIISGAVQVCKEQNNVVYQVPNINNADYYIWDLPVGVNGSSNTNIISTYFTLNADSGLISVKGSNICGTSSASSIFVNVNSIPESASTIIGVDTVFQGQNNVIFTTTDITGANYYIWQLPLNISGSSDSTQILVDITDSCLSGQIIVKGVNECGSGEPASKYIKVFKKLEIELILEGFYSNDNEQMINVQNEYGDVFGNGITDTLSILLCKSIAPYNIIHRFDSVFISNQGKCSIIIPAEITDSFYIVVQHRNHIKTWSSTPILFKGQTISYIFYDSYSKAYGGNQKFIKNGKYGIFVGDVNQDGIIDLLDLVSMDADLTYGFMGYTVYDLNGDGVVDLGDLITIDINITNGVIEITPQ